MQNACPISQIRLNVDNTSRVLLVVFVCRWKVFVWPEAYLRGDRVSNDAWIGEEAMSEGDEGEIDSDGF